MRSFSHATPRFFHIHGWRFEGRRRGDWQELTVPLAVEGRLVHLRLFLPAQKQPVEIDWIEIAPAGGHNKARHRWDFAESATD
jgi:hypothetical protein